MAPSLRGQKAVVVGLGASGRAAAQLLLRTGMRVTVEEVRPLSELGEVAELLKAEGAELAAGRPLTFEALSGANLVVVSPGVPLAHSALVQAKAAGIRVLGEVEVASWFLRPGVPLVGITGTNGKSTTTALCGELLFHGGLRPFVGGNLGTALSEAALSNEPFGAYVVELSSYQLEGLEDLRIGPAVFTNLAPDHLDRYASYEAYQAAKARIFRGPGAAVVNFGDEAVVRLALASERSLHGFTRQDSAPPGIPAARLGALATPVEGGFQIQQSGTEHRFQVKTRALRGAHNLENAMAAAMLARLCGVSDERIQRGLDSFPGLPHRLELVRTLDGVEWVNDSKATNVDSAVVALQALRGQKIWLIAGGKGKGAPYAPLVEQARHGVKGVLTVGADAPKIEQAFASSGSVPVLSCETLERAIAEARTRAVTGDAVLLSPACSSFDQFKNFEDRGQTFRRLVEAL
jgi:UDP-N-acetylmuramoylalanine--D-glutamate ligase